ARTIAEHPIELMPGIAETLDYLSPRHNLYLVTKGDHVEQSGKVERSGLKHHFRSVEVVAEKNAASYLDLLNRHQLPPRSTWMVGNSPRSDINPALAAGLNAVFVPHGQTWILEHEDLAQAEQPSRLLVVERFADLAEHF